MRKQIKKIIGNIKPTLLLGLFYTSTFLSNVLKKVILFLYKIYFFHAILLSILLYIVFRVTLFLLHILHSILFPFFSYFQASNIKGYFSLFLVALLFLFYYKKIKKIEAKRFILFYLIGLIFYVLSFYFSGFFLGGVTAILICIFGLEEEQPKKDENYFKDNGYIYILLFSFAYMSLIQVNYFTSYLVLGLMYIGVFSTYLNYFFTLTIFQYRKVKLGEQINSNWIKNIYEFLLYSGVLLSFLILGKFLFLNNILSFSAFLLSLEHKEYPIIFFLSIFLTFVLICCRYFVDIIVWLYHFFLTPKSYIYVFITGILVLYVINELMLLSGLFLVIIFFIAINLLLLKYLVLNKYVNFGKIRIYSHLFKETKEPFDDRYRVFLHSEVNFSSIDLIKDNPGAYSSREEDLIGIDNHVDSTYNIISSINTKDFYSFSIGIVGGWGVGKTSFINSLKTKYLYADSRIKLLDFRPWNYEGSVLIEHFLKELSISIDDRGLYRDINKYLVSLGKIYPRFTFLNYFSAKSSEDIRSEISKKLSRLTNKKIVVIIDDLDRCGPGEILSIFNIIKNVGYFKNIIYLISYDKEKVVKTLEEKKYSSDYLDKIINIEKNIPKANDSNLKEFFKDELLKIFTELDTDELKNSNSIIRLNHYLDHVVYELNTVSFFDNTNIRAIKRILNHIKITVHLEYSKQSSIFNRYIKDSIQVYPISFYDSDISSHVSVYNKLFYKSFITPIILGNICKVKDELGFYEGLKHGFSVGNYYGVFDLIRNMYVNAKNENQTDDFYKRFSIFS